MIRVVAFALMVLAASVSQAQSVARVIVSVGDVNAIRTGTTLPLKFGAELQSGDSLRTGPESYVQLRFSDGAIVALRSDTEFRIDNFRYNGVADGLERAFFSLVKGGFRTVTGIIGKRNKTNYTVQTSVSSIGIRGTHFNIVQCDGGCRGSDGSPAPSGTYGGVSDGRISATPLNNPTEKEFGAGEFFYVANANTPAAPLIAPPGFLTDKLEAQSRSKGSSQQQAGQGPSQDQGAAQQSSQQGSSQTQTSGISADSRAQQSQTQQTVQPVAYTSTELKTTTGTTSVLSNITVRGALTVFSRSGTISVLGDDKNTNFTVDSQGRLLSFGPTSSGVTASLGSGTIVDDGGFTSTDGSAVRWGAWTGGTVLSSSTSSVVGLPVLYGTANNVNQGSNSIALPSTGSVTYSFAGGPGPRDAAGNVGSVTSSTAMVDFGRQSLSFNMNISFANVAGFGAANISASGLGVKVNTPNSLDYSGTISGSCGGPGCQSGSTFGTVNFGTAGTNGYNFGVAGGGLVNGTRGGDVIFLNAYQGGSLTTNLKAVSLGWISASAFFLSPMEQPFATLGFNSSGLSSFAQSSLFASTATGSLGSGTIVEAGSDATAGNMFWGRWTGSGVQVFNGSSTISNPPTGVGFVGGDRTDVMPGTGTAVFTYVGGPNPTSVGGSVGTFSGGAFGVNFATRAISVATPLTLSVGANSFSLNNCSSNCSYNSGSATVSSMFLTGTCSGGSCSTASAQVAGVFVGNQAQGFAASGHVFGGASTVLFAAGFKR